MDRIFELLYGENGQYHDGLRLNERITRVRKTSQGEDLPDCLYPVESLSDILYSTWSNKKRLSVI